MSDESDGFTLSKLGKGITAWTVVKVVLVFFLPWVGYFFLQTVSKPFFVMGKRLTIGGACYQTIFVQNPGPLYSRNPQIEFYKDAGVEVVDYSPGVNVDSKTQDNKLVAKMEGGLPRGCNFFITYKFTPSPNADPTPKVVCDAKTCKESPTFDSDIMMLAVVFIGVAASCSFVVMVFLYYQAVFRLRQEKESNVNNAISTLIEKANAQADVNESNRSLLNFLAEQTQTKPQQVGRKKSDKANGQEKKQPEKSNPPEKK